MKAGAIFDKKKKRTRWLSMAEVNSDSVVRYVVVEFGRISKIDKEGAGWKLVKVFSELTLIRLHCRQIPSVHVPLFDG